MAITSDTREASAGAADAAGQARGFRRRLARIWRVVTLNGFSSLIRRIVFLNLAALLVLLAGILFLNQFRAGLIDARVQSLMTQGETIARTIARDAALNTAAQRPQIDPDILFEGAVQLPQFNNQIYFSIAPTEAAQIIEAVISPREVTAKLYDSEGGFLYDSRVTVIFRQPLAAPAEAAQEPSWIERSWNAVTGWFSRSNLPVYRDLGTQNGAGYEDVAVALGGEATSKTWVNESGQMRVSVAIPVQRINSGAVMGVLQLVTPAGDIDAIIRGERRAILNIFALVGGVTILLSFLLASTIAAPLRRLADAADKVRHGALRSRPQIPDFSRRGDEIGHLSIALREMTNSLYDRINAIDRFAADVAHELKNPLTSLRSAVETLPLARTDESKARLAGIIQHDVRRLDRLITDIAAASRLDAELNRREDEPVDVAKLLETLVAIAGETATAGSPTFSLDVEAVEGEGAWIVLGHDTRISQVFSNLFDNARSFSPPGGTIRVTARREDGEVVVTVDDEGPGIRVEPIERIFERFYTDRPAQESFGQNSGLGLSITRQIVEAVGGRIRAENRRGDDGAIAGARFTVRLPAAGG